MHAGRRSTVSRAVREIARSQVESGEDADISFEDAVDRATRDVFSRRSLLKAGAVAGAGLAVASTGAAEAFAKSRRLARPKSTPHDAKVVVVGAGLAGVTATLRLAQQGVNVACYEARERIGGRCWTAREFGKQTAEHGGEFIDTRHVHIRQLARELGLGLDDLWAGDTPSNARWPAYVRGKIRTGKQIHTRSRELAAAVVKEAKRIGVIKGGKASDDAYSYGSATPGAIAMDRLSMKEWIHRHAPGTIDDWYGDWLDEIMNGWYGLETDRLSAVTLMDFFVVPAPGADERWHVRGGNDQVTSRAANHLPKGVLHRGTPLRAMAKNHDGTYELRFGGVAKAVHADLVILTLPWTTLRSVDLSYAGFDAYRTRAIAELGMGADVKLLLQYDRRPWEFRVGAKPWSGGLDRTDPDFDTWESSVDQPGKQSLITVYAGGRTAEHWFVRDPHAHAPKDLTERTLGHIDDVVPGTKKHFAGKAWLDWWVGDEWTLGSYAAYLPGQVTKYWRYAGLPAGNVHFAGEHTSSYSQGYLNGGVESGDRTAIEVMNKLGVPVPHSLSKLPYSTFV
jgi:monoamine oxidase